MRCCWRRRRRRARAIAWLISAPASAPPALRSQGGCPRSSSCWSRSMHGLAGLARSNATSNAIAADVRVLDVTAAADVLTAAGLSADSADVVLMNPPFNDPARHRASPDRAREIAHVATAATLEKWIDAGRRILKSGGVAYPDLARRWPDRGAGSARSRLRQSRHSAGSRRRRSARHPGAGSRHQGRKGSDPNPCGAGAQWSASRAQ